MRVCGLVWGAGFAPAGGRANGLRREKRREKGERREKERK
nr:MAG TPA: hypothetical protein [Caudoviricetes sp.]